MRRLAPATRSAVVARAQGLCEYCRSATEVTGQEFTIDHIVPQSRGGADDPTNLCYCCPGCNCYQQALTDATDPRTGRLAPLFDPRRQRWGDHFRWSPTSTRVLGRTATGRATVEALRLNRPILVRARGVWVRHGLHPNE